MEQIVFTKCRSKKEVELKRQLSDLIILGSAERYSMQDNLMYDSPYFLRGESTRIRIANLIEDLGNALNKNPFPTH